MLDQLFSNLATGFAAQFGAPFEDASAAWPGTATFDSGGSITAAGTPTSHGCKVQFDAPTQAMRAAEGFMETDARVIVLAFAATLDTRARITVASGANAGTWELLSVTRDPAGIGYECRGRRL